MRIASGFAAALCAVALPACASTPENAFPDMQPVKTVLSTMQRVNGEAADEGKLAMYVLGANWCHDSVAFAEMLQDPATASAINGQYTVQFINVGYLEQVRDYVEVYDVPVIYGTPTVMVVDPGSDTLLNRDSLPYWRNASTRDPSDVREYFGRYSTGKPAAAAERSPALQTALTDIDAFERRQAGRIYQGYAILGPMLAARDAGESVPGFFAKWNRLSIMRSAITGDLARLRQSAYEQDAQGVAEIRFEFPEYELFFD